jgi:hypothetical protein
MLTEQDALKQKETIEAQRVAIEEMKKQNQELEKKMSELGEELSQTRNTIEAYRSAPAVNDPKDDSEDDVPDPIEKPTEFKKALREREEKIKLEAKTEAIQEVMKMEETRRNAEAVRREFFSSYPELEPYADFVEMVTQSYMKQHSIELQNAKNPVAFKEKAFKDIAKIATERIEKMVSPENKNGMPFLAGSGQHINRKAKGDPAPSTTELDNDKEVDDYIQARNKR